MKKKILLIAAFISLMFYLMSCHESKTEQTTIVGNPPQEGFNLAGSDSLAVQIADEVMAAMGGRTAWDTTRHIAWNFFGFRSLLWDKFTGNVRIEHNNTDLKILVNINTLEGKVVKDGQELTNADSLQKYLTRGKEIWINDSYWLTMPFKLKDSGVTLKYVGTDTVPEDGLADVLQLTFQDVGVTPDNRYLVYVDQESKLVSQWAYHKNFTDTVPGFILPWKNYQQYGSIKLSGDRGPRQLQQIQVFQELPSSVYSSFEPVPDVAAFSMMK